MIHLPNRARVVSRLGRVADFCPICRSCTALVLQRHTLTWHWFWIPLGSGKYEGDSLRCETCGTERPADVRIYASVVQDQAMPLDVLAARTFPSLPLLRQRRLELESRVLLDPEGLTSQERAVLVREPFEAMARGVDALYRDTPLDFWSGLAAFGLLALPIGTGIVAANLSQGDVSTVLWSAAGALLLAFILAGLAGDRATQRTLRKRTFPAIAAALRPLEPDAAEVVAVMSQLHAGGQQIGQPRHVPLMLAALETDAVRAMAPSHAR
jgi:hypothetical protein